MSDSTSSTTPPSPSVPHAIYDGGCSNAHQQGVFLRIANSDTGEADLIRAWANAFIQSRVDQGDAPFEVACYLEDTSKSLAMLADGTVDITVTYAAAEKQSIDCSAAVRDVIVFKDHFLLVGPQSNPAKLQDGEDISTMLNKLVTAGNHDVTNPPKDRPASRFLSRFDKSSTNLKESELFINIGQVPWTYDYSKWYHQYPRSPQEALEAAASLSEYTITDRGTWAITTSVWPRLRIYNPRNTATDPLSNSIHLLLGARASPTHAALCNTFLDWVIDRKGGQAITRALRNGQVYYSENTAIASTTSHLSSPPEPRAIYDGGYSNAQSVRLRIANGGAGEAGLIGAWANAFIQSRVVNYKDAPFKVAWYLGDTTQSLAMLAAGFVDVTVTYTKAAELESIRSGAADDKVGRKYAFRDHFMLVGPTLNPAGLKDTDDIFTMFNKLVTTGNHDVDDPPDLYSRPASRFLSRFDKSATNIKESELFIKIGQVPWAYDYSKWYHQYPRFPKSALKAASSGAEYTITDRGIWLSSCYTVRLPLKVYKQGLDADPNDPLLSPAHLLLAKKHTDLHNAFVEWVIDRNGGQAIIRNFPTKENPLYSEAP